MNAIATWWQSEARARPAYAVAAAIGLLVLVVIGGVGFPLGTSSYWDMPTQDHRAYLTGFRYFLDEPWHWPLLTTHTMSVPFEKSIAFTDSIPIWALLHKAIGTILPPWDGFVERAYLGIWYALTFALQACFGVAILRQLGERTWAATICTAVIFVTLPSWLFRFHHASLVAHWLLLWALLMYLRTPEGATAPRRLRIAQLVHLALCSLINPYHAVASLAIFIASLCRSREWRRIAVWFPLALLSIGISLWLAGYFERDAAIKLSGFDISSSNVLTFFLPRYSGIFGEALWRDGSGVQYEGLAYLGLGVILMLVLCVPKLPTLRGMIRRHPYLFAFALALFLFALSNHIYIGGHSLLHYKFPRVLRWVTYQFRAPGRFIWVPMYLIVIVAMKWVFERCRTGWTPLIIPGLVVLQLVDAWGHLGQKRTELAGAAPTYYNPPAWRDLADKHSFVYVMPMHDCVIGGPPGIEVASSELQYLASRTTLPINGVYSARPTRDCDADPTVWPVVATPGGLYVFLWTAVPRIHDFMVHGAECATIPFGHVCSSNKAAIETLLAAGGATPLAPPPKLVFGRTMRFEGEAATPYLEGGWSWPELGGRWSDGEAGALVFQLEGERPAEPVLDLQIASVVCGTRTSNDVEVWINSVLIGRLHFDAEHNDIEVVRSITIRDHDLLRGPLSLQLRPRVTTPPIKTKCNEDPRHLGVVVKSLVFR